MNTLVFNVEDATHSDLVIVRIFGGHYLSADALTGAANDNWTGVVSLRIHCKDSHGSSVISISFNITIRNVNDPPIITSKPVDSATVSQEYVYQITAVDGDNDPLIFLLQKGPVSMMVSAGGRMTWVPAQIGNFNISVSVGDGQATAIQDFSVNVTANHPPIFMSNPVTTATVNVPYLYNLSAVDDDGDALSFSLVTKPDGMSIGPSTGSIMWMPGLSQAGNHTVTVKVIDGRGGDSEQTFNITVRSNARPKCVITSPANGALVSGNVAIRGTAENGDAAITIVQVRADGGKWHDAKGIESWSCIINTIGLKKGSHVFEARAFDGSNYSDSSSVTLVVDNPQPYISSGNDLWWILPSVILVIVASVGVLFWKAGTRKTPK
jgi:hypothetical protein